MTDKANDKDKLLNDAIKASIKFEEKMDKTDFDSWLDGACLFNWNNISENDYELLIEYLNDNFEISGIEPSQIEKSRDCKTISISTGERSLLLKLNKEKTNANLEIDGVSVRDFTVETEGDKLNICFTDSSKTLGDLGQCDDPFKDYEKNKKDLEYICRIKDKGNEKYPKVGDKSSLERYLIYNLFYAKIKRLEARICSKKEDEEKEYKEVLHKLLSALNALHNLEGDDTDKRWLILLYNDLSICYAGLENSSMSRGYAEEARGIIEKEKSYKEFEKKWSASNSKNLKDIEGLDFVSSKLYDLYTVALFNQALAERRSSLYTEAERNFKKIIEYAKRKTKDKKDNPLCNFNYYSALLNLSDLYMDLSRGREAIDLLHKVSKDKKIAKEKDIRYWKAYLYEIDALIDQSEYGEADSLLKTFKKEETGFTLNEEHKVTSTGFKGLARYARCEMEKVKYTLKNNEKSELKKAKKIIKASIKDIRKRKQTGLEMKTYKHLSEIDKLLEEDDNPLEYFIKYLSDGEIDTLKKFAKNKQSDKWIRDCDDLDFLESFSEESCKYVNRDRKHLGKSLHLIFGELITKIKRECAAKGQLSRAERIVKQMNEVLEGRTDVIYREDIFPEERSLDDKELTKEGIRKRLDINEKEFDSIFPEERSLDDKELTKEDIRKRLDINEKEFDSVLFNRSEIKEKRIVELIVLRRWNSFSPGLFRDSTGSLGGGYLLRIKKNSSKEKNKDESKGYDVENIVIDPGYNFLRNFRSEGFYIGDIDTIIVTHSHLDHCAELLPIMDLIYQFNKRYGSTPKRRRQKKRVNLCLSQGAYTKFSIFTNEAWQEQLKDVIILENLDNGNYTPFDGLTISAIKTHHMDLGGVNAIGLKIKIYEKDNNGKDKEKLCLGFTSDTPSNPDIKKSLEGCDLLCVHLGSIKYQEIGYRDDRYNIKGYLFSWDEIPGNDNERLIKFLKENLEIKWVKTAKIEKIEGDKTLRVYTKENSLSLRLNEEETKVNLEIGDSKVNEFTVKTENGKLNIYLTRKISSKTEQREEFNKTYATANHLFFFGTLEVIESCANKVEPLIIVSEFGEELKYGLRTDLCKKLSKETKFECLPSDIGLYIGIDEDGTKKVRCDFCDEFVKPDEIKTFSFGREDAIQYICQTCNNTLSELQKHAIIKHRVTRH